MERITTERLGPISIERLVACNRREVGVCLHRKFEGFYSNKVWAYRYNHEA